MTSQNALNNQTVDADFAVNHNTAGASTLSVANANAAATAQSNMVSVIEPTAFAAFDNWNVFGNATKNWSAGILQSDGAWYLHQSAAVFPSAAVIKATTAGEVTMPRQPAFLVWATTNSAGGITGNGAQWGFGNQNGVVTATSYDQGGDITFPGNICTFTAPVSGVYLFTGQFYMTNVTAAMASNGINLAASVGGVVYSQSNVANVGNMFTGAEIQLNFSQPLFLSATSTVVMEIQFINGAGNTANVVGTAAPFVGSTYFSGVLLC